MNKKVDELVEWVAREIFSICCPGYEFHDEEMYRGFAKQILSHPDLALIDKTAQFIKTDEGNGYYLTSEPMHLLPVIPLAEALKEKNEH